LTENCYDLDGNNGLDVYDAILAFECARANDDIFLSPFHNHCLFPGGFTNVQHTADVKIVDHDEVNKTFDIHVSYLSDEIKAVQLFINGTTITSVLKAYGFGGSHFTFSNNSIIAFHAESSIPRHGDFFFFARVTYSDFEGNEICVSPNSVVVNGRFDKINVDVSQACLFSVSTAEEEAAKASISLTPNPVSDYLVVNTEEVLLHKMEILNIDGKLIKSYNQINNSANKLDTSDLGNGVYLIRFYTSENVVVTKKFVKSSF